MADLQQLERALVKADAAGDSDAAKAFASEIRKMRGATPQPAPKEESSLLSNIGQGIGNTAAGLVRGAGSIGATLLAPIDMAKDAMAGKGLSLESNRRRRAAMDAGLESMGAEPDSAMYQIGKVGGEIAGTAGTGGVLARGAAAVAPAATGITNALATAGMRAGANPGVKNMLLRMTGGAATGGAAAGLVDPEYAGTGAVFGAALPPVLAGTGRVANTIAQKISGVPASEALRQSAAAARDAGYVIPPTQVRPSLANRLLEGFAGKITTAQNASAKNQPITNELAKRAIGAKELTSAGLAEVRSAANAAYDDLAQVGAFQVDDAFKESLKKAGSISAQMRKDFPELVNAEVDTLVEGLSGRGQFDAQSAIEAIKQFRYSGSANKAAQDPAKKALGSAQIKIAGALEDLIDRNLQASGAQDLLKNYRSARQTLAKVYDVEKALNTSSGNIDAKKLGDLLKKGRPMIGELRDIGDFANQFPKAVQTVERMGSLPQVSPLDFGALGAISAATANPALMAGILARPAARSLVLSNAVQNRLAAQPSQGNALMRLATNPSAEQLLYRSAPVLGANR